MFFFIFVEILIMKNIYPFYMLFMVCILSYSQKLNSPLVSGGGVFIDDISSDVSRVVYQSDKEIDNVLEIYSVPITGGTPLKLNGTLISGGDVTNFKISPDGSRVVYRAEQETDELDELYSVPIGGGTPTKISGVFPSPPVIPNGVNDFIISENGNYVVYRADQVIDAVPELYSVPIGGGSTPVKISGTLLTLDSAVLSYRITPDESRVVYRADQEINEVFELYSVPLGGGSEIKLNSALPSGGDVSSADFEITSDGSLVIYLADQDTDEVLELYSVPVAGGTPTKLNGTLVSGGDVVFYDISADGSKVIFQADQDTDNVRELYSVSSSGGTPIKISGPMVSNGDVQNESFEISPDGSLAVYRADQDTNNVFELYSVPINGGTPTKLNSTLVSAGDVTSFIISPDGSRVVYRADQDTDGIAELYSVSISGGTPTKLNGTMVSGGNVDSDNTYKITPDGTKVVYIADQDTDEDDEIYSVSILGGTPTKLNGTLVSGGDVDTFNISSDSNFVTYRADQDTDGVIEIYSVSMPCEAPIASASDEVFGTETFSTITLSSYVAPSGGATGYAIYINDSNSFTAPSDGEEPTANTIWQGSGQQAIYFGTSISPNITVTGLSPSTTYYFQIYAYNDCSGTETYETTGLNANASTGSLPSPVNAFGVVGIGTDSPKTTLDVVGGVRALNRDSSGALYVCNETIEGTFGYDTVDRKLKVCTFSSGSFQWIDLH